MSAFPWILLNNLRCPCCGVAFDVTLELVKSHDGLIDGVLGCDCYEYPVVQGIPVLRQMSPVSSTQNIAVERLLQGDSSGALRWLLEAGSAPGVPVSMQNHSKIAGTTKFIRKLGNLFHQRIPLSGEIDILQIENFESILRVIRPSGYADYLFHRFANPSFLAAIPALIVLGYTCQREPQGPLLELLCGTGHSSAVMSILFPEIEVVMTDVDFVNLFIASRFMVPQAITLCIDVELPLPFTDGSFKGLYCLDGLHYVRSKVALLSEVDRVVNQEGAWVFAHMHNANCVNPAPGVPLSPKGYAERFAFGGQRILPEAEVIREFQDSGSLDLTEQIPDDALNVSDAITLVGYRSESLWSSQVRLDDKLCQAAHLFAINPLYRLERVADGLIGIATWPSESLRKECIGTVPLLPERIHLPYRVIEEIDTAKSGGILSDEVRKLLRSFVLVCLPSCYPRLNPSL